MQDAAPHTRRAFHAYGAGDSRFSAVLPCVAYLERHAPRDIVVALGVLWE